MCSWRSFSLLVGVLSAVFCTTSCSTSAPSTTAVAASRRSLWYDAPATRPALDSFAPTDDAPVDQLLDYYDSEDPFHDREPPSPVVRQRLLQACIAEPERLPKLLNAMPTMAEACDAIKRLEDSHVVGSDLGGSDWRKEVHRWLMLHSQYYRPELIAAAKASMGNGSGDVEGAEALLALASLDWRAAEPVLRDLSQAADSEVACLALVLRSQHARAAGDGAQTLSIRNRLLALVSDRREFSSARFSAATELFQQKWDSRVAWELSLIPDPLVEELYDTPDGDSPFEADAEQLTPRLTALLESGNETTRQNAAWLMLRLRRPDTLRPLLPVLFKEDQPEELPAWRLVGALTHVVVPGSVPGLLHQFEVADCEHRREAALALARQGAKEAPTALKQVMSEQGGSGSGGDDRELAQALLDSHALTRAELLDAMESAAIFHAHQQRRLPDTSPSDGALVSIGSIGEALEAMCKDRPSIAEEFLQRAASKGVDPLIADAIHLEVAEWPSKAVDDDLIEQMRGESLGEATAKIAAARAKTMRCREEKTLAEWSAQTGPRAALAAAILGDRRACTRMLRMGRPQAKLLLESASMAGTPLPLQEIKPLLTGRDRMLAIAAEKYLVTIGDDAACQAVFDAHPGECIVLGGHERIPPFQDEAATQPAEQAIPEPFDPLRNEVLAAGGPRRIIAYLSQGGFGDDGQRIVRFYSDRTTLTFEHRGQTQTRDLRRDEQQKLLQFIAAHDVDDLPALNHGVLDGWWYTYIDLTRDGGREVQINNPGIAGTAGTVYDQLNRLIRRLTQEMEPQQ